MESTKESLKPASLALKVVKGLLDKKKPISQDKLTAEDSSHWITLEGGQHVLIDGDGQVVSGAGGNMNYTYLPNVKSKSPDTDIKASNNLTNKQEESKLSSTFQSETANEGRKMEEFKKMKADGATSEQITAAMKESGLGIPERKKAWDDINEKKQEEPKEPKKLAVKKEMQKSDLSGIDNILDQDRRIKGTTGSLGKKLTDKEISFLNDMKIKSKLTEKQSVWLKSIGDKYSVKFNDLVILKPKTKKLEKLSFEEWASEYLDQDIHLMGEKERNEAFKSYKAA